MSAVTGSETEQGLVAPGVRPPLAVPRRLLRMRSDAALVERFAAGDEAAFDVIYERHRPVVLAVCMGVLGTPPDAEDATQETFSALAVALRTRPPAELRPWLIRVARNASIDTTRRRRHRLLTLDGEIPEVAARPAGTGQAELAVVLDGIRELPEGQRMALLMRELGGHSYSEIAEFLATDEEAVKGLIARARVGLRTYREATELSCATARGTIAAEPDGRRDDKTIRRHLRGCASCRGYRDALRDDAKALRAALPIQAGTVATGSLSSGMLSAAKGSLLTYGLTQAATTCAASACAVGAIGGMVFVAPVHRLGLPPILPSVKSAAVHKHAAARAPAHHAVVPVSHTVVTVAHNAEPATRLLAGAAGRPAITHAAVVHHHHAKVTMVSLPTLPKQDTNAPAATSNQATPAASSTTPDSNQGSPGQAASAVTPSPPVSSAQPSQSSPSSASQASQSSASQTSQAGSGSSSQSGAGSPVGDGQGSHWNGNGNSGDPLHSAGAATGAAAASGPAATGSASAPTVTSTTTTPTITTSTTSQSATPPGYGWGRVHNGGGGQPGSHHGGNWHQTATTQSTADQSTADQSTSSTQPGATTTTTSTATTTAASSSGWGSGSNGSGGWGSGSNGSGGSGSGSNGSGGSRGSGSGSNGSGGWGSGSNGSGGSGSHGGHGGGH
jgi:RNA polymerase sigma factor (sigma-70 family)